MKEKILEKLLAMSAVAALCSAIVPGTWAHAGVGTIGSDNSAMTAIVKPTKVYIDTEAEEVDEHNLTEEQLKKAYLGSWTGDAFELVNVVFTEDSLHIKYMDVGIEYVHSLSYVGMKEIEAVPQNYEQHHAEYCKQNEPEKYDGEVTGEYRKALVYTYDDDYIIEVYDGYNMYDDCDALILKPSDPNDKVNFEIFWLTERTDIELENPRVVSGREMPQVTLKDAKVWASMVSEDETPAVDDKKDDTKVETPVVDNKKDDTKVETPVADDKKDDTKVETPVADDKKDDTKVEDKKDEVVRVEEDGTKWYADSKGEYKLIKGRTKDKTANRKCYSTESVYVVQKGDCLWSIAKKLFGDGRKYTQLFTRNGDIVERAELIHTGQQIIYIPMSK